MAPITFAATAEEAASAQPAFVNGEHNPEIGNYRSCIIAKKEAAVELVDEEHNPEIGNYRSCVIA